jgi:hypothetical protein
LPLGSNKPEAPQWCCLSNVCNSHAVKELSKWAFE